MSAFRSAVESKDLAVLESVLAEDVVFQSPAVHKPYTGRDLVLVILGAVTEVFEEFRYVDHLVDGQREVLRFNARVGDRDVDGVDLVRYGADGRVQELSVMIRPLSALEAVRQAMAAQLEQTPG